MAGKTIGRLCLLLAVGLCLGFVAADQVTAGNACGCINGCSLIDCHCTACACGDDSCGCASWGSKCPAQACGGNTVTKNCECGGGGCSNVCPSKTFCAPNVQSPYKPCGDLVDCICQAPGLDGSGGCSSSLCQKHCSAATSDSGKKPCGGPMVCASDGCGGRSACLCGEYYCKQYSIPSSGARKFPCACWGCSFLTCECRSRGACGDTASCVVNCSCADYYSCLCYEAGVCGSEECIE